MPFGYRVFLKLAGRRAVVIGEMAIREGKVEGLLTGGSSNVTVIAERPSSRLDALAADDRVHVERRAWMPDDFDGAFICVASSALAKKLWLQLSAAFGEEWAEVLFVLREVRESTTPFLPDIGDRGARWAGALDTAEAVSLVREGRGDELRERLVQRLLGEASDLTSPDREGIVYLVGRDPAIRN